MPEIILNQQFQMLQSVYWRGNQIQGKVTKQRSIYC